VQDDGARERLERGGGFRGGVARVHHDRLAELGGQFELAIEELALAVVRRVLAVEVEAGLADRDRAFVGEQVAQLVEPRGVGLRGLVGMDPERGEDAIVPGGDRERLAAGVEARTDRDDPVDAGLERLRDELVRRFCARVEVRVGVDHAAAVG
jgi:hypothetical protein